MQRILLIGLMLMLAMASSSVAVAQEQSATHVAAQRDAAANDGDLASVAGLGAA